MKSKVVGFGEIMLRLSAVDNTLIASADRFDACYGGSEANVLVALSALGDETEYVSVIPDNSVGDGAIRHLVSHGVGVEQVLRKGDNLGLYFLEQGFGERPSKVIYNRKNAAITQAHANDWNMDALFVDCTHFHVCGISLALSAACRETVFALAAEAKRRRITVSFDFNYRGKLWTVADAAAVYKRFLPFVDICFGNMYDLNTFLGIEEYTEEKTVEKFLRDYDVRILAFNTRDALSASRNRLTGRLYRLQTDRLECLTEGPYEFDVLDRIGSGDCFAAGILHVLHRDAQSVRTALQFGLACAILKHTLRGDVFTLGETDIFAFLEKTSKDVHR